MKTSFNLVLVSSVPYDYFELGFVFLFFVRDYQNTKFGGDLIRNLSHLSIVYLFSFCGNCILFIFVFCVFIGCVAIGTFSMVLRKCAAQEAVFKH